MKVKILLIVIGALGTVAKGLVQGLEEDHPNYWITEIGQNAEKNSRDLRRLAVTQTPVKDHQLNLVGKNFQEVTIIKIMIM